VTLCGNAISISAPGLAKRLLVSKFARWNMDGSEVGERVACKLSGEKNAFCKDASEAQEEEVPVGRGIERYSESSRVLSCASGASQLSSSNGEVGLGEEAG
jgi:hypothetical protein